MFGRLKYAFGMTLFILLCGCTSAYLFAQYRIWGTRMIIQFLSEPTLIELVVQVFGVLAIGALISTIWPKLWWATFVLVPIYTIWPLGEFNIYIDVTLLGLIAPFLLTLFNSAGTHGFAISAYQTGRSGIGNIATSVYESISSIEGMLPFVFVIFFRQSDERMIATLLAIFFGITSIKVLWSVITD